MDLSELTNEPLSKALKDLQALGPEGASAVGYVQEVVHDLHVHRVELEMQNRTLRESQTELEMAIRRYTDLYDYSPTGYVTLSPEGKIVEANLTAGELLRMERHALSGRYFGRFLDDPDAEKLRGHLADTLAGRAGVVEMVLRPSPPNPPLAVQLSSRPAQRAAESLVRTAITDITGLKAAQQQLVEVNREQEAFSYSISHDLRTPLITISNLSSMLLSEFAEGIDSTAQDCLRRIHFAALRMDQLLTDLLEYSRISRSALQTSVLSVEQILDDVIGQHHGAIDTAEAKVSVHRPLPQVRGSPEALRQVLANLLTNALKFVRPGEKPHVEISARSAGERVVITVRDHGIGIPPEHRQRVFNLFERLHGQAIYPGTGLGLAIVRRAVDRMGGKIWVESEEGPGTAFFVELPAAT